MNPQDDSPAPQSELLLYRDANAHTRIEVRLEGDNVWLPQRQIAELYQVSVKTISEHLQNIFDEGELEPERTIRKFRMVQAEGPREVRRLVDHYNLAAILAVGYRVRSARGTQFRQWASQRLSEYLVKGFAMDDERLKRGPDDGYFEELLARIRDIRSSERMFWRKVLDIYATSIDYDASADASQRFFQTVQNKMHWAAHGHTAAEVVLARADARQPNMGMTSTSAGQPRRQDAPIAKNYLHEAELDALNRIVTAYLEFAELQALNRQPMTMADWIAKLDDFLRLSGRDLLTHAGRVRHDDALRHAQQQYDAWRKQQSALPQAVDRDFDNATQALQPVARKRGKNRTPKDNDA
ncbi:MULTISPECIES: virulence RhuM family protein [Thermomonas]|uniref:virulence RhuM family protein n=1 Tax=Thermomonas TaxID=141948 RepID=UPI00041B2953|nr:virulence RhuM family protein [Thermomonas fusca]